ncbi:MAG: FAD-dependent oxidoreductase [Candidatus Hinthialibacter antarcticus]|nr:FAD-dependent oxidoreductase [Candidatus Hinthialibacter antarcticus]
MSRRTVILGAGIAGLATAWKLLQLRPDEDVVIIERENVIGGLAKSIDWNGYRLDLGPHRFHTEIPEIKEFVRAFCEEKMVKVKRSSRMWINGRYIPYPIKALPTFQALGPLNSILFGLSALSVFFHSGAEAKSYQEYVSRYYGARLYEAIFAPFARKVWGIDPSQIAADTARVRLRGESIWHSLLDGFFSKQETYVAQFLYPQNGIGEIAEKFAAEITQRGGKFYLNQDVLRLNQNENGVSEVITSSPDGELSHACDVVVSTVPLPNLVDLIDADENVITAAQALKFRAIVLLYLMYGETLPIEDTWLYYPEEHVRFTRASVPDNFNPHKTYENKTCICVEFTCEYNDETWNAAPELLSNHASEVLYASGLTPREPTEIKTVHIKEGYPVYQTEYEDNLHTVLNAVAEQKNILTTGRQGLFRHNNIDQSIQMGLLAAEQLVGESINLDSWYQKTDQFKDYRIVD